MQGPPPGTTTSEPQPTRRRSGRASSPQAAGTSRLGAVELLDWLTERGPGLVEHWIHELRARELGQGTDADCVVESFAGAIVEMLPLTIGPHRDQVRSLWDRTAELYGAIAAKRGLAAGEAIEELHILRELVIRELYRDPPGNCSMPLSLREFLRLSRSLDRAVTHASVGHTDALFFQFFEGDGVGAPVLSGDDVSSEAGRQLEDIRAELGQILRHASWNGEAGARES